MLPCIAHSGACLLSTGLCIRSTHSSWASAAACHYAITQGIVILLHRVINPIIRLEAGTHSDTPVARPAAHTHMHINDDSHPVRSVLEAGGVQDQHQVPLGMKAAYGAEVAITCTTVSTCKDESGWLVLQHAWVKHHRGGCVIAGLLTVVLQRLAVTRHHLYFFALPRRNAPHNNHNCNNAYEGRSDAPRTCEGALYLHWAAR